MVNHTYYNNLNLSNLNTNNLNSNFYIFIKYKIDSKDKVESIHNENLSIENISKFPDKSDDMFESIDESEEKAKVWIEDIIKQNVVKSIAWSEFSHHKKIGSGNFGLVFKTYWYNIHNYVVYKKLMISPNIQYKIWEAFKHEIHIQIRAHNCENIIRVLGISKSKFDI